mgnify:CR=1 FL=1
MARTNFDDTNFSTDATIAFSDFNATVAPNANGFDTQFSDPFESTIPMNGGETGKDEEILVTMPAESVEKGTRRVVGWLVCTKGECLGQDFHLHSDYNYIGRGAKNEVSIPDPKVSSDAMCWISYDNIGREFTIGRGDNPTNVTRLNNKPVYMPQTLKPYDRILLGDTELMFVPLCSEDFTWGEDE